jgi:four helix bundle protein
MKRENVLKDKSFEFALRVVSFYKDIVNQHKEYVLSKQFLRSGTSVGALVREAEFAQSKADFISKLSIALKEANETEYWIILLEKSDYLSPNSANELLNMIKEIISILVASIKTTKKSISK